MQGVSAVYINEQEMVNGAVVEGNQVIKGG